MSGKAIDQAAQDTNRAHMLKRQVDAERQLMRYEEEIHRLQEQLRVKLNRIQDLEAMLRLMRSRVETAVPPFGQGMELRYIISAHDLVEAVDPHALIEYTIDRAKNSLHLEIRRMGLDRKITQKESK